MDAWDVEGVPFGYCLAADPAARDALDADEPMISVSPVVYGDHGKDAPSLATKSSLGPDEVIRRSVLPKARYTSHMSTSSLYVHTE